MPSGLVSLPVSEAATQEVEAIAHVLFFWLMQDNLTIQLLDCGTGHLGLAAAAAEWTVLLP